MLFANLDERVLLCKLPGPRGPSPPQDNTYLAELSLSLAVWGALKMGKPTRSNIFSDGTQSNIFETTLDQAFFFYGTTSSIFSDDMGSSISRDGTRSNIFWNGTGSSILSDGMGSNIFFWRPGIKHFCDGIGSTIFHDSTGLSIFLWQHYVKLFFLTARDQAFFMAVRDQVSFVTSRDQFFFFFFWRQHRTKHFLWRHRIKYFDNVEVWVVSTCSLISKSSSPFTNTLGIVPSAPITTGITVTFLLDSFFNSLARSRYLYLF